MTSATATSSRARSSASLSHRLAERGISTRLLLLVPAVVFAHQRVFTKVLAPMLIPGILAASILVLVRTVGMFDLTFLVSGPRSDTLVVAIYRAMTSAGGGESRQLISSMGVIYTAMMLIILVVALRFINPTQLVAQVKESRDD